MTRAEERNQLLYALPPAKKVNIIAEMKYLRLGREKKSDDDDDDLQNKLLAGENTDLYRKDFMSLEPGKFNRVCNHLKEKVRNKKK